MPLFNKNNNKKVSSTVIKTPCVSVMPNSNCKPMAIPKTSAKSQAAMAISASMYKLILTNLG